MRVIDSIPELRKEIHCRRIGKASLGLVPTMGALHEGHLSLIRKSREENDVTAVSIFVNPIQFNNKKDLETYPRDEKKDLELCSDELVDIVFTPSPETILGSNLLAFIDINELDQNLCGAKRPGHFRGVCTIVGKLFNIFGPDRAYFGKKDIQQLMIIKKMVLDLNFPVQIVPCEIVREPDGLAMSSRNIRLSRVERQEALVINRSLKKALSLIEKGETDSKTIIDFLTLEIDKRETAQIDYIQIVNPLLQNVAKIEKNDILALAVFFGDVRLIDNHIIGDAICW